MKLYGGPTSPFVRKAKLWSMELGIELETVPTNVTPAEVNEDYRNKNPLVQVPALELDDGFVLSDSHIICDHLARAASVELFPAEGRARDAALQTYALLNGATEAMVQCAYETIRRPAELKWDAYLTGRFAKLDSAMDVIAETGSLFEIGERLTYNQVALVCAIDYGAHRFPKPRSQLDQPWRLSGRLSAIDPLLRTLCLPRRHPFKSTTARRCPKRSALHRRFPCG